MAEFRFDTGHGAGNEAQTIDVDHLVESMKITSAEQISKALSLFDQQLRNNLMTMEKMKSFDFVQRQLVAASRVISMVSIDVETSSAVVGDKQFTFSEPPIPTDPKELAAREKMLNFSLRMIPNEEDKAAYRLGYDHPEAEKARAYYEGLKTTVNDAVTSLQQMEPRRE